MSTHDERAARVEAWITAIQGHRDFPAWSEGAAMARHWGMPIVGDAMLPMGTRTTLHAVTELGHALTAAVYRGPNPPTTDELALLARGEPAAPQATEPELPNDGGSLAAFGFRSAREGKSRRAATADSGTVAHQLG